MKLVKDFMVGDKISTQLLVVSVNKGINSNHTPYLSVEVRDSSGSISGKVWNANSEDELTFVPGSVVYIEGDVLSYKDNNQLHITVSRALKSEEIDVSKFVKAPPIAKDTLKEEFFKYVNSLNNEHCRALISYFVKKFENSIFDAPAASSIHHEYASGLLMHEVTMAKIADSLCSIYKDINRDLLITGALLHDVGKLIELEGPVIYHYSLEGKLLGHISIMSRELKVACEELKVPKELELVITHMILSHHGELEFGSPVMPIVKEALILSFIDNMDSKITCLDKALEGIEKGEFTQKIFSLDNRSFYKPKL